MRYATRQEKELCMYEPLSYCLVPASLPMPMPARSAISDVLFHTVITWQGALPSPSPRGSRHTSLGGTALYLMSLCSLKSFKWTRFAHVASPFLTTPLFSFYCHFFERFSLFCSGDFSYVFALSSWSELNLDLLSRSITDQMMSNIMMHNPKCTSKVKGHLNWVMYITPSTFSSFSDCFLSSLTCYGEYSVILSYHIVCFSSSLQSFI